MLGVESEYYHSAVAYIERMRQLEHGATRILAHFEPVSYLLTSPHYAGHLRQMLAESPQPAPAATIDALLALLEERKQSFARSVPPITSLIDLRSLERFVHFGLVGRLDPPPAVRMERLAGCPARDRTRDRAARRAADRPADRHCRRQHAQCHLPGLRAAGQGLRGNQPVPFRGVSQCLHRHRHSDGRARGGTALHRHGQ
ncbi:hypothetical protein ACU4GD_04050 [Cupriavidus basilensis]